MPKMIICISSLLVTLIYVVPAAALPADGYERYYFSGPDFKKEIGERILTCGGEARKTGKETQWFYEFKYACKASGSPNTEQCIVCEPKLRNCVRTTCPPDIDIDQKL